MLSTSKSIILCGICTLVTGTFFDWKEFHPKAGDKETLADHSDLSLKEFEANGTTINYVCGSFTFLQDLNDSIKIHYVLQHQNEQSQKFGAVSGIPDRTVYPCEFVVEFLRKYMLPMVRHHNDFPLRNESWCPIDGRTYHIYSVEDFSQLVAPSDLKPAEYEIFVTYFKDGLDVGGFEGQFRAVNT